MEPSIFLHHTANLTDSFLSEEELNFLSSCVDDRSPTPFIETIFSYMRCASLYLKVFFCFLLLPVLFLFSNLTHAAAWESTLLDLSYRRAFYLRESALLAVFFLNDDIRWLFWWSCLGNCADTRLDMMQSRLLWLFSFIIAINFPLFASQQM